MFLVGVHCVPEELDRRERIRGDRQIGEGRTHIEVDGIHTFGPYDFEDDTTAGDPRVRKQLDELICSGRVLAAVALVRQDGGLQPTPSLFQAHELTMERRAELDRLGLLPPKPPPPTTAELIAKADAVTAPIVAIEARWDGDTQGWHVYLVAIVRRPGRYHHRFDEEPLTVLRFGGDIRVFNGQVPPWPEAHQATEQGQAVARHVGVPFHFTSPDEPDVELPRWWDSHTS